jgi:hypothetical protein
LAIATIFMTNYNFYSPDNEIELTEAREALVDSYLNQRDTSYDDLVAHLERLGGKIAFHDSEKLTELTAEYSVGTLVRFSEKNIPSDYQSGTLTDDAFLVPLSSIDRPQNIYRPHLCATIQNDHAIVNTLLFPIAKRSDGHLEVVGLRPYSNGQAVS